MSMTLSDARRILDRVREGFPYPVSIVTLALQVTGDIRVSPSDWVLTDSKTI